ncbi:MAG TPA: asparagine synthase (glutamine-hydrolyzing), partial [Polyangia bacterium]|nr:asparagine synthase (glutamine-hydrolyzing) [Polyangia bacterium]
AHRGPDGDGFYFADGVGLGHRRLAIIDPAGGEQPMFNEDGSVVIVFNGCIYNHVELHRELVALGHVFRSRCDTEVILHAWESWGPDCLQRFNGFFSLALWDSNRRQLFLARDRLGKKPLHYAVTAAGQFVFSSELGSFAHLPELRQRISATAIDDYFAFGYIPEPQTIFEDILHLPAAHFLVLERGRKAVQPRRYWQVPTATHQVGEAEAVAELTRRLTSSVGARLIADVPLGAFLSGGVDSSIVVACMARATSAPVKTFSVGFAEGGREDNELPYARLVAERWRTEHHELVVEPDMVGLLPSIVRHHGEPFADTSAVPTRYLCEMTQKHVKVALSGDAGDEAFGGYRRYVWAHVADTINRLPRPLARGVAAALAAAPGRKARWLREYGACLGADEASRYLRFVCHFSSAEKNALYTPELAARFARDATAESFAAHLGASRATDTVSRLQNLDVETYLPDDILAKVDVASMTHALEARAPLVDHHVVELGAALPGRLKLRGRKGKHILKRAFADLVPAEIVNRRKKGFSLPTGPWLRGRLHGFARDTLLSDAARARGLFRPEAVTDLLDRHRAGEDHGERLWNLIVLETWQRELVDGRAAFAREMSVRAAQIAREALRPRISGGAA